MQRSWLYREVAPLAGMVAAECAAVASNTIFKAASAQGISFYVFTFYTSTAAALLLLPFSFLFRRTSVALPSNKLSFFFRLLCLAAIGVSFQLLAYIGLEYSSPTLSSALSNLVPALTFILASLFRMEKVDLRSISSIVKMVGASVSISGALVVVLYKGSVVLSNPNSEPIKLGLGLSSTVEPNWVMGGLCFFGHSFLNSIWYILLTKIVKIYEDEVGVVAMYYTCGAIICALICVVAERDLSAWRLKSGLQWMAVMNSGFVGQAFVTGIHTWGLHLKGPVYVSSFRPLAIAIAAAAGVIFFGENLYLGSVVGAIIICIGFYALMWGKAKEEKMRRCGDFPDLESSSNGKTPLLQSSKVQDGLI